MLIGIHISLNEALSQAIWPGNWWTSGTTIVWLEVAQAPHTPLLKGIVVQATYPWNGPSNKVLFLFK